MVAMHAVVSVDGFIADDDDQVGHGQHMLEDADVVVQRDRVLHLRYPVRH